MGTSNSLITTNTVYTGPEEERRMTAAELKTQETEQERIERWRCHELERAGYEASAAAVLATRHDVDLHSAIDLIRAGCRHELALEILL